MGKRRPSFSTDQLIFSFDAPVPAQAEASLAGLGRQVASAVGEILHKDERNRHQIAARMSELLDESVTKDMLDAYASEARDGHNISFHRMLALIAATDRHDVLDAMVRQIGGALLIGEEIHTARLGHLNRQIEELRAEMKKIEKAAKPIGRGTR